MPPPLQKFGKPLPRPTLPEGLPLEELTEMLGKSITYFKLKYVHKEFSDFELPGSQSSHFISKKGQKNFQLQKLYTVWMSGVILYSKIAKIFKNS